MKILYLTHRLPFAPNRGDRIRAYYMLREMSRFAEVSLLSFVHDDDEAARVSSVPFASTTTILRVPRLRNLVNGVAALPTSQPLTHALLDAPSLREAVRSEVTRRRPDLVVAYCSGMARLAVEMPLQRFPFVLDMVDVDSAKWQRLAAEQGAPKRWVYAREARTLATFESAAARSASLTLVVNDRERDALRRIAPEARLAVVPNGIEIESFRPPDGPGHSSTIAFCGVMNYAPNEVGVLWFVRDVWPIVRRARPDAVFRIVGANPTRTIRNLASQHARIEVIGSVPAVQPYLWDAAVSVAPIHVAQGLQNKVLEALAAGLPVVTTTAVGGGLPDEARPGCLVTDGAREFAERVLEVLQLRPVERRARAASARLDELSWSAQLAPLNTLLSSAIEHVA